MTGAAKAIQNAERKVEESVSGHKPAKSEPTASVTRREPQIERRAAPSAPPAPRAEETPVREAEAPAQARLSGVDSKPKAPEADMDEDLFEIPTFLRRQAN